MKRLLVPAIVLAAVAAILLINQDSGQRTGRTAAQRAADLARDRTGDGDGSGESGVADAARIAELVKKYGGFTSKGSVVLTLPKGPGINLDVVFRVGLDGSQVDARAKTDAKGRFAFGTLPRATGYALTVEGSRVQPFARSGIDVEAAEHDFGELTLNRYYFVSGRVSGEGNRPVRGATVALVQAQGSEGFSIFNTAKTAAVRDAVLASVETGNDGRFSLRLNRPGMFTLGVRAKGWAPHYRTNLVVDARSESEQDIQLTRGESIVGWVFDGAGRPVAAASVVIYTLRGWFMGGAAKELERTDDAGRFEFRVEPYNARYSLRVVPPEGIDIIKTIDLPLQGDLILRLPGTGVLTGKVISAETQQPIAGADVMLGLAATATAGWAPDFGKVIQTDEYGVFRVGGVGKGFLHSLSIRATAHKDVGLSRMYPSDRALWNRLSKIPLGGAAEVNLGDIPLSSGRVLVGTVKEAGSGTPIPGAEVALQDFIMGNRDTVTDGNGMYRFDGVGARVSMAVRAAGFAPFREGFWTGTALPEGEKRSVRDIELKGGGGVFGRVEDQQGNPLKGALVRLESAATGQNSWQQGMQLQPFFAFTDEKGEYRFNGVPPLKVRARGELTGYDRGVSKDKQINPGVIELALKIVMPRAARFSGRVVSRAGGAVSGARITVAQDPGADASRIEQWRALSRGKSTYADTDGRFIVNDVPTGNVLVRIEADMFATSTVRRSAIKPGQEVTSLVLRLAPAYLITGRVLEPDGKAMATGWVSATHTSSPDGEPTKQLLGARLESEGYFTIRNLPAGTYKLQVQMWSQAQFKNRVREGVAAGTKDLVIKLAPPD